MNLDFNEVQLMLRTSVRDFIAKEYPIKKAMEAVLDTDICMKKIWPSMKNLGWMGIPFDEHYGGGGLGFFEFLLMLEETSRGALYTPYLSSTLCGLAISQFGSEVQKKNLLPKISDGNLIFSLAWLEDNLSLEPSGVSLTAEKRANGEYIINGTKILAPYAQLADNLLVVARTAATNNSEDGVTIFIVPTNDTTVTIKPEDSLGFDYLSIIQFKDTKIGRKYILGDENNGWPMVERLLEQGALCHCAEMIGACDRSLEMSLGYSRERIVYGKPIGTYQIQQHRLAEMWMKLEGAREFFYFSAWNYCEKHDPLCASEAKALISDFAEFITEQAVRLHGAIGLTWELGLGLFYRRVRANAAAFGNASFHKKRMIKLLESTVKI